MLDKQQALPEGADVWWMSQFLDCCSPMEILSILRCVRAAMKPSIDLYIIELFWDAQRYEAASYILKLIKIEFR